MDVTRRIEAQAAEYSAVVAQIRELCGEGDETLLLNMIEGESNLEGLVGGIVGQIAEDESHCEAVTALLRKLSDRRKRLETRAQRLRIVLAQMVDELPDRVYRHPLAHLRAFDVDPKVIVLDESQIPTPYWKVPEPKLDEPGIRRHLLARMKRLAEMRQSQDQAAYEEIRIQIDSVLPDIPGVCLGSPEISVRIRMS